MNAAADARLQTSRRAAGDEKPRAIISKPRAGAGPRDIPAVRCRPGCHNCCRSPAATAQEYARLAPRVAW